jgi:hypothetical protein
MAPYARLKNNRMVALQVLRWQSQAMYARRTFR